MKQLLLIASIFTCCFCSAQIPPQGLTQKANDSAIQAAKLVLNAKISGLQASYDANPASSASAQATKDVVNLLRDDMQLRLYAVHLETDLKKQAVLSKAIYQLEESHARFNRLADDPATNHSDLLKYAREFQAKL